jgi:hypothetical protein
MGAAQSRTATSTAAPKLADRLKNPHIEDFTRQQNLEKEYCFAEDEKREYDENGARKTKRC